GTAAATRAAAATQAVRAWQAVPRLGGTPGAAHLRIVGAGPARRSAGKLRKTRKNRGCLPPDLELELRQRDNIEASPERNILPCRVSVAASPPWRSRASTAPGGRTTSHGWSTSAPCASGWRTCCGSWLAGRPDQHGRPRHREVV